MSLFECLRGEGIEVVGADIHNTFPAHLMRPIYTEVLTTAALRFVATLSRHFDSRRLGLLDLRKWRDVNHRKPYTIREGLGFLPDTECVRNDESWQVEPAPDDRSDPHATVVTSCENPNRLWKCVFDSAAQHVLADCDDSCSPTWHNIVMTQVNLRHAIKGTLRTTNGESGARPTVSPATIHFRPRPLHLEEPHVLVDGRPVGATWFDLGLFVFHNTRRLVSIASAPSLWLTKLESHAEAQLWEDVCAWMEEYYWRADCEEAQPLGWRVRVTVVVDTVFLAVQLHEVLHVLRQRCYALCAAPWAYLFAYAKTFRGDEKALLPPPSSPKLSMSATVAHYEALIVNTCRARGAISIVALAPQPLGTASFGELEGGTEAAEVSGATMAMASGFHSVLLTHASTVPRVLEELCTQKRAPSVWHRTSLDIASLFQPIEHAEWEISSSAVEEMSARLVAFVSAWLCGHGVVYTWVRVEPSLAEQASNEGASEPSIVLFVDDMSTMELVRTLLWSWMATSAVVMDTGTPLEWLPDPASAHDFCVAHTLRSACLSCAPATAPGPHGGRARETQASDGFDSAVSTVATRCDPRGGPAFDCAVPTVARGGPRGGRAVETQASDGTRGDPRGCPHGGPRGGRATETQAAETQASDGFDCAVPTVATLDAVARLVSSSDYADFMAPALAGVLADLETERVVQSRVPD